MKGIRCCICCAHVASGTNKRKHLEIFQCMRALTSPLRPYCASADMVPSIRLPGYDRAQIGTRWYARLAPRGFASEPAWTSRTPQGLSSACIAIMHSHNLIL
jgi:hypothetical protein